MTPADGFPLVAGTTIYWWMINTQAIGGGGKRMARNGTSADDGYLPRARYAPPGGAASRRSRTLPGSVRKLLCELGYYRQANRKAEEGSKHPDRNAQFDYINAEVLATQAANQPVISVDIRWLASLTASAPLTIMTEPSRC